MTSIRCRCTDYGKWKCEITFIRIHPFRRDREKVIEVWV